MNLKETVELLMDAGALRDKSRFSEVTAPNAVAIIEAGKQSVVSLEDIISKHRATPLRKKANVSLRDVDSFCQYWALYHNENSRVFGDQDLKALRFTVVLDYHGVGEQPAAWREHTATYTLTKSVEWETWLGSNGKKMNQADFATFIEDNAVDIIDPPSADMVQVARELDANTSVQFSSGTRLNNGQQQLKYVTETKATVGKSTMEVPERFTLRLVAFVGMPPVDVVARLRYRINDGTLSLWYDLLRPHKVAEKAFNDAMARINAQCSTTVLLGAAN